MYKYLTLILLFPAAPIRAQGVSSQPAVQVNSVPWKLEACPSESLPTERKVQPKDTLWDLAGCYYHDPFKWPIIAQANPPPKVNDPHWIYPYPKNTLVIPALEPVTAPVAAPAPAPAAEEPAAEPAQTSAAAPVQPQPELSETMPAQSPKMSGLSETSLSSTFPKGLVGNTPSTRRFVATPDWKADGMVLESKLDGEHMLAQGDTVDVRIDAEGDVGPGDRYLVLRKSVATEDDDDQNAAYLADIGVVKIISRVSDSTYEALILRSYDAIQASDMIKKEK